MPTFTVDDIRPYRGAHALDYLRTHEGFTLTVRGVRWWRTYGRDLGACVPCLSVAVAGTRTEGRFAADHERWVVLVKGLGLRLSADGQHAEFDHGGVQRLPLILPLARGAVAGWVGELQRMRAALRSGTPAGRLRAELGVHAILRALLDGAPAAPADPPARLHALIAADPAAARDLAGLSRRCGLSADHLRELFTARYGMTPAAFRTARLMEQAAALLLDGLPPKQVARRIGYARVQAFGAAFRRHTGETPGAVARRARLDRPEQGAPS